MKSIPDILRALTDANVQFVLVGGFAVQLHGFVRTTIDLDLVLAMTDENLSEFIKVAKQFGLEPVVPVSIDSLRNPDQIDRWHREKGMFAFGLREPQVAGSVIDVLVRPEVSFGNLHLEAVTVDLFDRAVKIASIEHLILMKRIANRPKDRIDIEALEKIQRGEDPYV
ncbi:MAG: nucleotidyl transferase AbiEii/AbiGii toxin family protein [Pseudomonadota bacterium]